MSLFKKALLCVILCVRVYIYTLYIGHIYVNGGILTFSIDA